MILLNKGNYYTTEYRYTRAAAKSLYREPEQYNGVYRFHTVLIYQLDVISSLYQTAITYFYYYYRNKLRSVGICL